MGGMTGSLLLLLLAGVSVSTMVDLQKRIINGQNCRNNERQYHVKLIMKSQTDTSFCGGSLISDEWILTAAHCWEPGETIEAVFRVHPGVNKITEPIQVKNIKIFKDKDINGNDRTHDIMLLRLTTPRPGFKQIKLPYCANHPTPRNVMVQIAGHGATTAGPGGKRNPGEVQHLQCADVKAIDCPWAKTPNQYQKVFCGQTDDKTKPVDACHGDSGGGVVYKDRIYGVIVTVDKKACTAPVEFMDVCGYMPWITQITAIKPPKSAVDKIKDCFGCG
ncbi:anionic trypsin-2-like isoform X1 [Sparus aurata]|uniref:Anionic trypsin-2-like n=1 Tax=Sparus aurata TaxID=8175 RepID=A0A671WW98_SPAAU|nr:anionic trypsin-2-like isoform X1 [Sparus aurata]XP_030295287.1 anionic trypsin-2-like isoform X1 [Sparus aurata]